MTRSECHSKCLNRDLFYHLRGHCVSRHETARLLTWVDYLYYSVSTYTEVWYQLPHWKFVVFPPVSVFILKPIKREAKGHWKITL